MRELNQAEVEEVTGGLIPIPAPVKWFLAHLLWDGAKWVAEKVSDYDPMAGTRYDPAHQEAWHNGFQGKHAR